MVNNSQREQQASEINIGPPGLLLWVGLFKGYGPNALTAHITMQLIDRISRLKGPVGEYNQIVTIY